MYQFYITSDLSLLSSVFLSNNNKDWLTDDLHKIDNLSSLINDKIMYIACYKETQFLGIFGIIKEKKEEKPSSILNNRAEAHLAFLPCAYGQVSDIGKECLLYLWNTTDLDEIIAPVVEENIKARKCVERMGFTYLLKIDNAWVKNNKASSMICYHILKNFNIS